MSLFDALHFATDRHAGTGWKGTSVPFVHHPLAVAALVLKYGGNDAQAEAALLYDTIGSVTEAELAGRFGAETAHLAFAFADPPLAPGAPDTWRARREAYLRKLATVDDAALLVVACEELHELGDLLHDLKYTGAKAWERSPVHAMELGWYYREILALANRRLVSGPTAALVSELGARVSQLHGIVYEGNPY